MAAAGVQIARDFSLAAIGRKYHALFEDPSEKKAPARAKKPESKKKKAGKRRSKAKKGVSSRSPSTPRPLPPPKLELQCNPSDFNVFCQVRQTVLERELREMLRMSRSRDGGDDSEIDDDDDDESATGREATEIPKIVGLGLFGVFELIRETRSSHPDLCKKALSALLNILQGQELESMQKEPDDVIHGMFELLMSIVDGDGTPSHLSSLGAACLISLVLARGDTGLMLQAVGKLLMADTESLSEQPIQIPGILVALQHSVRAFLLGGAGSQGWNKSGVQNDMLIDRFQLKQIPSGGDGTEADVGNGSLTSDGQYLYICTRVGLLKIGSGYCGTVRGQVYAANEDFHTGSKGWLGFVRGKLYYCRMGIGEREFLIVNTETLQPEGTTPISDLSGDFAVCFSTGHSLGLVQVSDEGDFTLKHYDPSVSPMKCTLSKPLVLARRALYLTGKAEFEDDSHLHLFYGDQVENVDTVTSAREFAIVKTTSGKLFYTGRGSALGIKSSSSSQWEPVSLPGNPKAVQLSGAQGGEFVIVVAEDGVAYFFGTSRKGEDGDQVRGRRQQKPMKAKKMGQNKKLKDKQFVECAASGFTSALVTKDGQLVMFGKDTEQCDSTTGILPTFLGIPVQKISMGKGHYVVLTQSGVVYTWGLNTKGQCGRCFVTQVAAGKQDDDDDDDEEEEEEEEDNMCAPGTHDWVTEQCKICTVCEQCTGYGEGCCNNDGRPGRDPGSLCGCGSGDSGCGTCGCCKKCAEKEGGPPARGGGFSFGAPAAKPVGRARGRGARARRRPKKGVGDDDLGLKALFHQTSGPSSDQEEEEKAEKAEQRSQPEAALTRSPAEIKIGSKGAKATDIACGAHHTLVLLDNGEVFAFGQNQCGQLGQKDKDVRGAPILVPLPGKAKGIATGHSHSVVLLESGEVYTFGKHQDNQLGARADTDAAAAAADDTWNLAPGRLKGIGKEFGSTATWVGASGDHTYIQLSEHLLGSTSLDRCTAFGSSKILGLIPPPNVGMEKSIKSLFFNKRRETCTTFDADSHADLSGKSVCLDPNFDTLWTYAPSNQEICCYNAHAPTVRDTFAKKLTSDGDSSLTDGLDLSVLGPRLSLPLTSNASATRLHVSINALACLNVITSLHDANMKWPDMKTGGGSGRGSLADRRTSDYQTVSRFTSFGGGWGYSGHSVEAIRFSCDQDVLLCGFGIFGGRGDYKGNVKIFDVGENSENEPDGELLAEVDEKGYDCPAREYYAFLFDEPVQIAANNWYVAWARISGPSSDCGSSGQTKVTTEDDITFQFKQSRKSNNGTDVGSGQIPALLYKLPKLESDGDSDDESERVHVLSRKFSKKVTVTNFEALLNILRWSWSRLNDALRSAPSSKLKTMRDNVDRYVFIAIASLRLLRSFVEEVYPRFGPSRSSLAESEDLAVAVLEMRTFLSTLLKETDETSSLPDHVAETVALKERVINECHRVFLLCFHAFYPTGQLKWLCLSELLQHVDLNVSSCGVGRLLAAVMDALSSPRVRLSSALPSLSEESFASGFQPMNGGKDESTNYPVLESFISLQTLGSDSSGMSFRQVVTKLLAIVAAPVHKATSLHEKDKETQCLFSDLLIKTSVALLSAMVGELALSAVLTTFPLETSDAILESPNRYTSSQVNNWNTGNGSADAICFEIDRSGVSINGVGVYGGGGSHKYEIELLAPSEGGGGGGLFGGGGGDKFKVIGHKSGNYSDSDCNSEKIAHLMFDTPIPIDERTKYALRLRNHGGRTSNGSSGRTTMTCGDGLVVTFSQCRLSQNGTGEGRGQIPCILYSTSSEMDSVETPPSNVVDSLRKGTITIVHSVLEIASELVERARDVGEKTGADPHALLGESHLFGSLLPLLLSQLGPVAASTPHSAVKVLDVVKQVLPSVTSLGRPDGVESESVGFHQTVVESDHPYKPGSVSTYKVELPDSVQWMVVEFDPQCAVAQTEDHLTVSVPRIGKGKSDASSHERTYWPVLKQFSSADDWPKQAVVLPGKEIVFSLETASEYSKDENVSRFGFRCTVIGHEWSPKPNQAILLLEKELAYLAGMCASSLMKPDLPLSISETSPQDESEEKQIEAHLNDAGAQQIIASHSQILNRGLELDAPVGVNHALSGKLPLMKESYEKTFLLNFLECAPGTGGERLARWLQPDAFVDPAKCEIVLSEKKLKVGWLAQIGLKTKDRVGHLVHVSDMKVIVKGRFIGRKSASFGRTSNSIVEKSLFDGIAPSTEKEKTVASSSTAVKVPEFKAEYKETVLNSTNRFRAISMMKDYQDYSFEELRFYTPAEKQPVQTWSMTMQDNNDGTYIVGWIPNTRGNFSIEVAVDGNLAGGSSLDVEVDEPELGSAPPPPITGLSMTVSAPTKTKSSLRKFVTNSYTGGLRIRNGPSLQTDQIGVIKPDCTIRFEDEISNKDGDWVKLSEESVTKYVDKKKRPESGEAWCMAFHKEKDIQILFEVPDPQSPSKPAPTLQTIPIATGLFAAGGDSRPKKLRKKWKGGAGEYEVVRCGEAGHNIRSRPNLKGTPVGLLCRTNRIKASEHVSNADGDWLKLEHESVETYCERDGDAWTMARNAGGGVVYLEQDVESEYETDSDAESETSSGVSSTSGAAAAAAVAAAAAAAPVPAAPFGFVGFPVFSQPPKPPPPPPAVVVAADESMDLEGEHKEPEEEEQEVGKFGFGSPPGIPANNSGFSFGGGGGFFGQQQPSPFGGGGGLFGQQQPQQQQQPAFGGGGLFGAPQPPAGGLFGGGAFGGGGGGLFGQAQQPAGENKNPGLFGAVPPRPFGGFGAPPRPFGGAGFGVPAPAQLGAFVAPAQPFGAFGAQAQAQPFGGGGGGGARSPRPKGRGKSRSSKSPKAKMTTTKTTTNNDDEEKKTSTKTTAGTAAVAAETKETSESKVRKALSPAVAKCMRAAFVAFLWHEGITDDAIACSSHLKFNPELTKDGPPPPPVAAEPKSDGDGDEEKEVKLPPALKHLAIFWDDLVRGLQLATSKRLPQPKIGELKIRANVWEKPDKKKAVKAAPAGKGKAAKGVANAGETICELCDKAFRNPVTYHMKREHPGCGRHAAGQGYNSSGLFCSGWAGNCGDGGHGGSTWYLMCRKCRDKYMSMKKETSGGGADDASSRKSLGGGFVVRSLSGKPKFKQPENRDAHVVITENCKFLLELGSAAENRRLAKFAPALVATTTEASETLSPETLQTLDQSASPSRQFQFLQRGLSAPHGAAGAAPPLLRFAELPPSDATASKRPQFLRSPSIEERISLSLERSSGLGNGVEATAETSPGDADKAKAKRPSFLRSISLAVPETENEVSRRKRSPAFTPIEDEEPKSKSLSSGRNLVESMSPNLYHLVRQRQNEQGRQGNAAEVALKKPLLSFICQQLDLDCLRKSMVKSLLHVACRVHALEAFEWLLRHVTQTSALHDVMWYFAMSLTPPSPEQSSQEEKDEETKEKKDKEEVDLTMGEHPSSGLQSAGSALTHMTAKFHCLLQTIADLMSQVPAGSAVQQMAMRSWCIHFQQQDHTFLHRSYVFSRINEVLTQDETDQKAETTIEPSVSVLAASDILALGKLTSSSRSAMLGSLTDGTTETFWESGDEDKFKMRWLQIAFEDPVQPETVFIHVDNQRDSQNRTDSLTLHVGKTAKSLTKVTQSNVGYRYGGWFRFDIPRLENDEIVKIVKIDIKGANQTSRVRQLKLFGWPDAGALEKAKEKALGVGKDLSPADAQRKQCEAETLRVFRLLTSQVFGKGKEDTKDSEYSDLTEHVVGILFGQNRLSSLQKQVCIHIVQSIKTETARVREEWENCLKLQANQKPNQKDPSDRSSDDARTSDTYCFELLSMVLALSGSDVGVAYLAEQYPLHSDLLDLLHIGTPRVQRQVLALLRRILAHVTPQRLALTLGVTALPKPGFSVITQAAEASSSSSLANWETSLGILDVFLACIAKGLTVQAKQKGSKRDEEGILSGKGPHTVTVANLLNKPAAELVTNATLNSSGSRWWLRGKMNPDIVLEVIKLLKDMTKGTISEAWAEVTKAGIGEAVLSLTRQSSQNRKLVPALHGPVTWLSLGSLCVLDEEDVKSLSSGQWGVREPEEADDGEKRPFCDNHDDDKTVAIIKCDECGNLCSDCDRVLHLSRKAKNHQRQIFKEEEEAIKVDLHEGCGRIKLFWITALADARTLKAMVEFRDPNGPSGSADGAVGVCRFCGSAGTGGLLAIGNVCADADCQERAQAVCTKTLACGHACCGVKDEEECLPCLNGCKTGGDETDGGGGDAPSRKLTQDGDDMCMICYSENLSAAPVIQLECGHLYHYHCAKMIIEKRWTGPRITFRFLMCPICETKQIKHKHLTALLKPVEDLYDDVRRKALMRLEYDNMHKCEAITTPRLEFYKQPAAFAMKRYAYYVCFKCKKAYYGGEARCIEQAGLSDEYDPSELVCGGCSDVASAQVCPKHGTDYLEYKCRYCCTVAVFFCFGTTHFCSPCHDDFQRLTSIDKGDLPQCPVGPTARPLEGSECPLHVKHPPTGEEFALGCGVCRNAQTF
ncbi:E3 ubiquitin-protein ligase MYCBP2-like isoform X3 [Oscarella lobularis]|uniref:E3 ubiquitin-protein ligase MYCBP2-like isoform X3 n=1 Tax=Oscarella lobularis TaxID=121494 RepID=UPI0033142615